MINALLWVLGASSIMSVLFFFAFKKREEKLKRRFQKLLKKEQGKSGLHQNRLQAILSALQASPNGVVLLDDERRIKWCNLMATRLLGFDDQRDVDQHIAHLVRNPAFLEYLHQENFSTELRFDHLALQIYPYGAAQALLLVRDVTDIERAEKMRRDFVANVSHEIRTPLTVLSGFIETLQELELSSQERQHYLQLMATQSNRMSALVTDLLTLSKLDSAAKPSLEQIDVMALLRQCEDEAVLLADNLGRRLKITFDIEPHSQILGVMTELQSAFSNLVSNAVRYTPSGGEIHVKWQAKILEVKDSGVGIAPEHLPRLTERFFRVDTSRHREIDESAGTGLGLAIVKHVAQRHNATLEIESVVGVGSLFRLRF